MKRPACELTANNPSPRSRARSAAVIAESATNEPSRLVAASIGVAMPADPSHHGYISEHHSYGQNETVSGEYAEDLAASMLATVLGVPFEALYPVVAWLAWVPNAVAAEYLARSVAVLLRRPGSFKVTPKHGAQGRQPRAVLPGLAAIAADGTILDQWDEPLKVPVLSGNQLAISTPRFQSM